MRPRNLLSSAFLLLLLGGCGVTITETSRTSGEGGAAAILRLFELPSLVNVISEISPPEKGEHQTEVVAREQASVSDEKRKSFLSVRKRTEASW